MASNLPPGINNYDDIPEQDNLTFTIVHPDKEEETPFDIHYRKTNAGGYAIINGTVIDSQQLSELGMLMFVIGTKLQDGCIDVNSVLELLDGFGIAVPIPELEEMIEEEKLHRTKEK